MRQVVIKEEGMGYNVWFEDPAEPVDEFDERVDQLDETILEKITKFLGGE